MVFGCTIDSKLTDSEYCVYPVQRAEVNALESGDLLYNLDLMRKFKGTTVTVNSSLAYHIKSANHTLNIESKTFHF